MDNATDTPRIAIAATFTAEPLAGALSYWVDRVEIAADPVFAPYNQVFQALLDPQSVLSTNSRGLNAILLRPEDWLRFDNGDRAAWRAEIQRNAGDFSAALAGFLARPAAPAVLVLCPASPDLAEDPELGPFLEETAEAIAREATSAGAHVVPGGELPRLYPCRDVHDSASDREGHAPFTEEFYAALGTLLARLCFRAVTPPPKVIALDADNTLWRGVVGEDGPAGVIIDEPFKELQAFMRARREAGALLCVCSKNEEADVREVFANHPDMVLTEDDIAAWAVNWDSKSQNIAKLAGELNLGVDSFAFVDDNPLEIAEVTASLPVLAVPLPPPDEIATFLRHFWPLDLPSRTTSEDLRRTEMYQSQVARTRFRETAGDFASFLAGLELEVDIAPAIPEDHERLAQLTQRTNQFNASSLRKTTAEVTELVAGGHQCLTVRVRDRFGDYGLVGAVFYEMSGGWMNIDTLLLSCRVLGRGVEQRVLAHLATIARDQKLENINILYYPSGRNTPVRQFLDAIGSEYAKECEGGMVYFLPVSAVEQAASAPVEAARDSGAGENAAAPSPAALLNPDLYREIATESHAAEDIVAASERIRTPRPDLPEPPVAPRTETEERLARLWRRVLHLDEVGVKDRFADLGGKSMQVLQLLAKITREFGSDLSVAQLFENSTIARQATLIEGAEDTGPASTASTTVTRDQAPEQVDLAVVGMSARVPEARTPEEFWQILVDGRDCLRELTDEELISAGVDPAKVRNEEGYVPVKGLMPDVELFDAAFFGILPKDAKLMDPQQRVFLELAWEALENAGYDSERYPGKIGVWAGNYLDTYAIANLCSDRAFLAEWIPSIQVGSLQAELGNDKDYLATRVSYKMNLRGPAMTVQTACSTSLVAISQACQSLRAGECDMALAGGIIITLPEKKGYYYTPDAILSQDGSCRAFDEQASGTVFSNGGGLVLLKRLDDALRDGDHIYSVIKGSAVNNDGGNKHSYTAPSVDGQADVICNALANAQVDPNTISYVEAHGTGTPLGDPIEIAGLTKAFRSLGVERNGFCAVGSVKTNVGHLDVASGVTSLIKTSLALQRGVLPPTIHFQKPNPKIDFAASPFFVNAELRAWNDVPVRRAGISSFGVGGTNAHVILEEPPEVTSAPSHREFHLFPLSARSEAAADAACDRLVSYGKTSTADPADVSYTLRMGRKEFAHRRILVGNDLAQLADAATAKGQVKAADPSLVFMFPGQGSQTVGMGRDLYRTEPFFAAEVDRCAEILKPFLGEDLRDILYPGPDADAEEAAHRIKQTVMAQPAIFVMSYCQARLLMHWGAKPTALIGHSVGELVAACLAGVVTLESALEILAARGRLMQEIEPGGMLSIRLPEEEVEKLLNDKLDLAAVNGPELCVIAGPHDELEKVEQQLADRDVVCKRLHTSHGFHSWMMDPVIEPFHEVIAKMDLHPPQIPIRSTVTTDWLSDEEATDPDYWAAHVRRTVRFTEGVRHFQEEGTATLVEVGPGQTLSTLSRQNPAARKQAIFSTSGHATQSDSDALHFQLAVGKLWLAGHTLDWAAYDGDQKRLRVPLPTYPFEHKRFWIDAQPVDSAPAVPVAAAALPLQPPPAAAAPEPPAPSPPLAETMTDDRKPALTTRLQEVLSELSGIEPEEMEPEATLIELGFDSLMLTQVSKEIQSEFGVATTMRQLLDSLPTIAALVDHLDAEMPVEKFTPAPAPAPGVAAPVPAAPALSPAALQMPAIGSGNEALDHVIAMQMEIMRQQLAVLGGQAPLPAPAPAPVPAPPVPRATSNGGDLVRHDDQKGKSPSGPTTVINRNFDPDLTAEQQAHLDALVERYTTRTRKSKEWTARYRQWHADPRTVSGFNRNWKEMIYQIVVEKSKGSRLLDIDGNEYIDCLNGFGPGFFGHSPDFVVEAIESQLHKGFEVGPQTPLAGETAQLFCEITGNERASFVNTGSEAVQAAMRLARTVTGRDKIAIFTKDYHGNFDEVLVRGMLSKGKPKSMPSAPGIPKRAVKDMLVLDYGTDESLEILKQHAHELAAIMVEPVQSRRPEFRPRDFIHELRKLTEDHGALLIFDEVICGLRDGPHGAQGYYGVKADLATYGKVVGGGLPIGVVAGKADYMDTFDGGMWNFGDDSFPEASVTFFAGTFVRHPFAIAAANASLKHVQQQGADLWEQLNARASRLYTTIDELFVENEVPIRVPGFNSRFFIRVAEDSKYANLLFFHLRSKGVFLLEGFPSYITTAHTDEDIDYVIDCFKESVMELQNGGFFPRTNLADQLNCARHNGPPPRLTEPEAPASPFQPAEEPSAPPEPERIPLTEPQREIWLACELGHEASCSFNEATTLVFDGSLDRNALERALDSVVNRHDALRSAFAEDGESWSVAPVEPFALPFDDVSTRDEDEIESAIQLETDTQLLTPFDLSQPPLLRAKLLKVRGDRHILYLTAHHIVCDGWSFNVLIEELSDAYNELTAGNPVSAGEPASFAKYASERSTRENEGGFVEHTQFWLKEFSGPVPVLDLPTDRPFPAQRTFAGATIERHVGKDLLKGVRKAGAIHGSTLYATLLSAFEILLHRLTRQASMVVGIPAAGQSAKGYEDLVGHCVNFLPLRAEVPRDSTFGDLVKDVKSRLLAAYEHQDCAYGQLLPKLDITRLPGRMPLVEVAFNVERMDYFKPFDGLETRFIDTPKRFVSQLLFFNIVESRDGLSLECHFNRRVLDNETVARWVESYVSLLEAIASTPLAPLASLSLLEKAERDRILALGRGERTGSPGATSIPEVFESIVRREPDAAALLAGDHTVTYRQLNDWADLIASNLRAHGLNRNEPVIVQMHRSFDFVAAALGVLKAGGAYVPVDPEDPEERARRIHDLTKAKILLTRQADRALLPAGCRLTVLEVDQLQAPSLISPVPVQMTGSDLAYIMFTSGTTGTPKGAMIPHRGVIRLVRDTGYARFGSDETYLQAAPLGFDAATFEIWAPLLNGGLLVIMPPHPPTLAEIGEHIRKYDVTTLWLTAGLFQLMVDERLDDLKPLRQLLTGGDVLSPHHVRVALAGLPGVRVINGYGPTENTTFSCCHTVTEADTDAGAIPIGRPIAHSDAYILGPDMQPTAPGVEGEIYLGGDGLALGYLNDPARTAEKFVTHPFSSDPGARLYRSGDFGSFREDGTIEFHGRTDGQVKIRGFRIETGEIEQVLCSLPEVHQACVVAAGADGSSKRLIAYVVGEDSGGLIDHLRTQLPAHLVPSQVIPLDSLPLTANGKIDRAALPEPESAPRDGGFRLAGGETEERMAALWKSVLDLDEVPVNRGFFELGGHSLQALKLFNRIEREFGIKLPLATLFESSTVEELARRVAPRESGSGETPSLVAIQKEGTRHPLFLVHGGDGGTLMFRTLAERLDDTRPVYALEAPVLSGGGEVAETIEETAASYLSQIKTLQPEGPYLLSGYCFGGVVVYEIAQQLRSRGEEVELLLLLDTDNPAVAPRYLSLAERAATSWKASSGLNWARRVGKLGERIGGGLVTRVRTEAEKAAATMAAGAGLEVKGNLQTVLVRESHERAMQEYKPKAYEGNLVLFTAEDQGDKCIYPPHLGWEGYVRGKLRIIEIPGQHLTIFEEPQVDDLAAKLQAVLNDHA